MPSITALLHTDNDALRLGRCLETLYPCDHIVIVDHGSRDGTLRVAREYGARFIACAPRLSVDEYLRFAEPAWILTLDPRESLTENLAASLFEWKSLSSHAISAPAFSLSLREETAEGWTEIQAPQTRLVTPTWNRWKGKFPLHDPLAVALEGELLRFAFP